MHSVTSKPIQRNMRVIDVIALVPGAESLFLEYGLHCVRCSLNTVETLEEGCLGHGMNEEDIDDLIGDLNELFFCQPKRPEKITVTKAGAEDRKSTRLNSSHSQISYALFPFIK